MRAVPCLLQPKNSTLNNIVVYSVEVDGFDFRYAGKIDVVCLYGSMNRGRRCRRQYRVVSLGPGRGVVVVEEAEESCDRFSFLLGRGDPADEGLGLVMFVCALLLLAFDDERWTGTCIPRDGRDNDLRRVL